MKSVEDTITSKTEKTFQYDKDLLTLPVPELEKTAKKYLESVRNHVSDEEYKSTEFLVQQFVSGEGKYLQQKLVEKAKVERNWLAKWWEDVAYLEARIPAPYMNMAGPSPYSEDIWPAKMGTQVQRAALVLHYILQIWQHIRRQTYKPMKDGKGRPLDMYQFRRVFNTCTIPGAHRDDLKEYFQTDEEGSCPDHVIAMCKGHPFVVHTLDESGEILTAPELQTQFQRVVDRCKTLEPAQGVQYLTSEERTRWATARNELIALNPHNFEVLEKIQSSIMCFWFESGPGGDPTGQMDEITALTNKALLGFGENRWLDKSLSSGIYEDGLFVSNGDHTPAEGMLMVYVTDFVHKKLHEVGARWQGTTQQRSLPEPELLKFVLDENLKGKIEVAKANYAALRKESTALIWQYTTYGKNYCKGKRFHPDAVCQMAFHYGYYLLYGKMAPAYETAPTKQFYRGRTETLRSCTDAVKLWCEAMVDPSIQVSQKLKLFANAVAKHNYEMAEACEGRGIDRHMLGLYLVAREEGRDIPMIFMDPSFAKSGGGGNYVLSTSCIGYTSVLGGVLPMCKDGYGVFYRINDNRLTFYITTWNADEETDNKKFGHSLTKALDQIKALVDQGTASSTARL
ncbi:peroxisomal carnitine O-octanoyltransferase isoform X2 [Aplysia californica]|nr:peroxisomal carnitine O-octanoyltransferase isoform X2 [Aplysia californica]